MAQAQFILIGDDRFRLSIIKRYYPSKSLMDSQPNPYYLNVCTGVQKSSSVCIPFKTSEERQLVIDKLDKLMGI